MRVSVHEIDGIKILRKSVPDARFHQIQRGKSGFRLIFMTDIGQEDFLVQFESAGIEEGADFGLQLRDAFPAFCGKTDDRSVCVCSQFFFGKYQKMD